MNKEWWIEEKIRELAYFKWECAGCPNDMADYFWIEAEKEVQKLIDEGIDIQEN